jgi:4Fe-4S binding domain
VSDSKPTVLKNIPITVSKAPIEPPPGADAEMVALYQAHKKIYPRSVTGLFSRWRWALVFLTQIVFYGLPWLEWGQRQAVLFDLGARRFYIFSLVLYPQDFIYLTGLLVISAYALFLFTAVAGRLWCGYACPQTVYTELFLWLEKLAEGDRSMRRRALDAGKVRPQGGQASHVDCAGAVDRLYLCRLLHAHPCAGQ